MCACQDRQPLTKELPTQDEALEREAEALCDRLANGNLLKAGICPSRARTPGLYPTFRDY